MTRRLISGLSVLVPALWLCAAAAAQEGADPAHPHHGQDPRRHGRGGEEGQHHAVRHDFSNVERWSKVFDEPKRDAWQKPREVTKRLEVAPGMTLVDLGAGTGYFLAYLSEAAGADGRVLALDPEPNLVEFMTERAAREGWANVEARRIPFDDPELADGSVDRILIVDTWHHIEARASYAAKLLRALKDGGRVFVVDFTLDSPSGPPKEHRLEPEKVVGELVAGGFEAEIVDETLPRQYIVVGRKP